jgi:micrococcal nuclease
MENSLYHYNAMVTDVYDGDTITVDIDLGLKTWLKGEKIRLFGINAPELRKDERPEGLKSRNYLRRQINGKEIVLKTIKDKKGKYGRYLGVIYLKKEDGSQININELMIAKGYAKNKKY